MKIELKQINNGYKNEFEIKYNNNLKYRAKMPVISPKDPLNIEKIKQIKIVDLNDNEVYITDYKFLENFKEDLAPLKYLITGSQKFNQLLFISNNNTIKISCEKNELFNARYVIEINDKMYFCYSIQDGYIRHLPIYDAETQIGEAVKSNIVIDNNDEYFCYLKDGYENISDGIIALLLYLDRWGYSSTYLVVKTYDLKKKFSYNKTNKFYNKDWLKNNFGDEFYQKVNNDILLVKQKLKNPVHTLNSMPTNTTNPLKIILLLSLSVISILVIILMLFS